jgi:hypothetical protein
MMTTGRIDGSRLRAGDGAGAQPDRAADRVGLVPPLVAGPERQ